MSKESKIRLVAYIILVGFVASLAFHSYMGQVLGRGYPFNTFAFIPQARWSDFTDVYNEAKNLRPYERPLALYMPLIYVVMHGFTYLSLANACMIYLAVLSLYLFAFFLVNIRSPARGTFQTFALCGILAFLSYGYLIILDRCNLDGLTFVVMSAGYLAYKKDRHALALLLISVAGAFKLYPLVLILLYCNPKQWRFAAGAVAFSVLLMGGALLMLRTPPLQSLAGYSKNMADFRASYVVGNGGMGHSCSLFATFKVTVLSILHEGGRRSARFEAFMPFYSLITDVLLLYIAVHLLFLERELWRKLCIGLLTVLVFPAVSGDYRLILILLVLVIYFDRQPRSRPEDLWTGIALATIIIPKQYLYFRNFITDSGHADVSWNVYYNPPVMLALVLYWLWQGWMERTALSTSQPLQAAA